ncbi:DUF429 domain-containing protein [Kribbella sp. VKM Ac-2568]|uniref:DUF429 domain-containing protein n=1 Tax=Kribbella sp. VKM Ac-2568 TaxID=2512219 RepID=UPI00104C4F1D|nr:DUF429 domain-containing protein [Kribbella sp. VKM Ac-2568]TCM39573.1 putative RNase H-like nuclease [Kribbella sp. VKM Ac-2568]
MPAPEHPVAPGVEYFVGVDLAWGQRGTTGLAVLDHTGSLLDVTTRQTDEDILDWLRPWTAGPCFVAFDAPIIVVNPSGHRSCERLVSRHFGRFGASCHAANTANPSFTNGSRALRLADALDLGLAPTSPRRAAEVYPHPALVTFFDLPKILTYKHKPGRDFPHLHSELLRLITLLDSLADASPPLLLKSNPEWHAIRSAAESATRKSHLKRLEDAIDSVVCAYIALYTTTHPTKTLLLGTPTTGQILVPVSPTQAHQIDHP